MPEVNPLLFYLANQQKNPNEALVPYLNPYQNVMAPDISPEVKQQILNLNTNAGIQGQPMITKAPVIAPKPGASPSLVKTPNQTIAQVKVPVSDMDQQHELEREIYEHVKDSLMQQQAGVGQLEDMRNQIAANPTQVDLSPLNAYVDSIVKGSKLQEGYKRPESGTEKQSKIFTLQDAIQKAKQGMSKDEISALKEQLNSGIYREGAQNQRMALQLQRIGMLGDKASASAADAFDHDEILKGLTKQQNQINIDKHTFDAAMTKDGIPVTILKEIAQGQGKAISGGGTNGLGQIERQDVNNASQKLANLIQGLKPGIEYVNDPALIQYFKDNLNRLGDSYSSGLYKRAQTVSVGRTYSHNPQAQETIKSKIESYKPTIEAPSPQDADLKRLQELRAKAAAGGQ